jgi:uncharacterized protein
MEYAMRRLLLAFFSFYVLAAVVSCRGGAETADSGSASITPPQQVLGELPMLAELDSAVDYKHAASFGDEELVNLQPELGNHTSNAITGTGFIQLPSLAKKMSAAWYGVTVQYVLDDSDPGNIVRTTVPYVAPYELRITKTGGKYWFLTADYSQGRWEFLSEEITDDTHTFPIGLAANAANAAGTFWFAVVTYGGENVTLTSIAMDYPSQDYAGYAIDYHENIAAQDHTNLATDIILPLNTGNALLPPPPYPVVLFRTPYSKNSSTVTNLGRLISAVNAVMIIQYFRGRLNDTGEWPDSGGTESIFRDHVGPDHTDGLDTLAWIKQRQFYNGTTLLAGWSALGIAAYQEAAVVGADIKGFYPLLSSADVGSWAARRGGCFKRSNIEGWITNTGLPTGLIAEAEDAYSTNDADYWDAVDYIKHPGGFDAPGWHETGWFDVDVESTIASWQAINTLGGPHAAGQQWLVIGPWWHDLALRTQNSGDLHFPNTSDLNDPSELPNGWDPLALNQWAFYILGRSIGYTPPANHVLAYFIGEEGSTVQPHNRWYELAGWPPAYTETTLYLGGLNQLTDSAPASSTADVVIDPANPVPTLGGANLNVLFAGLPVLAGPRDQLALDGNPGVVHFVAAAPGADTSYAGPFEAVLYVSVTGAVDSDVMLKLVDVYPGVNGAEIAIADSAVRLSRYLAETGQGPLVAGQVYEVHMEIGQRAWVLADDHYLRLDAATTNYPRFDINPGDGNAFYDPASPSGVTGTLTLHLGGTTPSHIVLPEFNPATI